MLKLESPVSVNMDNITLTSEAVGVTMGLDAYILDKVNLVGFVARDQVKSREVQELIRQCVCFGLL